MDAEVTRCTQVGDRRGVELFYREDGHRVAFKIPVHAFHHGGLSKYLTASEEDRIAESISVDRNGIEVGLEVVLPRFEPCAWSLFWGREDFGRRSFSGLQAVEIWNGWRSSIDDNNVDYFLQLVSEGRTAFEDLREIDPSLFEHPRIMRALAIAFRDDAMPKRKKGKKRKLNLDVVELYGWAHWYREEYNLTWVKACERACHSHEHLVPESWEDAVVNLQKEAKRYLDGHPYYGQSKRRKDR